MATLKRVLTGIQPSGRLHLGNYLGAIRPMVAYQNSSDLYFTVVNLHSLTTVHDAAHLQSMTLEAAMDLLALGIDPERCTFWLQGDVPEVVELAWILSCIAPMGLLERAHSYKDKVAKGLPASLGLFNYPVLMAADVLLYKTDIVPVGKDQKQHMEIARDLAIKFNHDFRDVFTVPEPEIPESVAVVPGTDGQKMSKSYNNTIPIFATDAEWKKAVMSIVTDSKPVEASKDAATDTIYQLYAHFATREESAELARRYKKGGLGYGEAKNLLLEKIKEVFAPFREKRAELAADPKKLQRILQTGAERARVVAQQTLNEVRKATGLRA